MLNNYSLLTHLSLHIRTKSTKQISSKAQIITTNCLHGDQKYNELPFEIKK